MKKSYFLAAVALTAAVSIPSFGQTSTSTPADNSGTNKSDAHMNASADAQKNDKTDLSLSRRIRQSVMADKSLSTYAHNVKIVSVDGRVTLNGVVGSADERASVYAKAVSIAGQDHVVDQMTIAPPKS
jgi:osmotically-inducible protein OsmY